MKKLIYIIIFLVFSFPVFAADHYFDFTDGNDTTGNGTSETPWKTISKANTECTSGDTCHFASEETWTASSGNLLIPNTNVIYDGSTYGSGTRATFKATGNMSYDGIILINVDDVTIQGFDIDGDDYYACGIGVGGIALANDVDNTTIDDCVIHDLGGVDQGDYGIWVGSKSTSARTVSNVTITNVIIHDVAYEGIAVYSAWGYAGQVVDTVLVRNCTVYNTGQVADYTGVGIMAANGVTNVTFENNTSYNNPASGIGVINSGTPYTGEPTNIIVRYNIVYGNLTGINLNTGANYWLDASVDVYSNLIYGNTSHGIVIGIDGGTSEINIYNNTVLASVVNTMALRVTALGSSGTILYLKNNIFYASVYYPVQFWNVSGVKGDTEERIEHSNNLLYRADSTNGWILNEDFTEYNQAQVVSAWEATAQNTNPTFSGGTLPASFSGTYGTDMIPNTSYFSILSGDALDNGETLGSPYNGCINGAGLIAPILRPQGTAYDIGAYEFLKGSTNSTIGAGTSWQMGAGTTGTLN